MSLQSDPSSYIQKLQQILNYENVEEGVKIEYIRKVLLEFDASHFHIAGSKLIGEIVAEHDRSSAPFYTTSIKTGLESYDLAFGGLWPGEFVVIGGRPAMGKTLLLVNMAINIAANHEVLYYSLDLSNFMLSARIVASLTQLPTNYYMHGNMNESHLKQLELAKLDLSRLKLRVLDQQMHSMTAFKALCRQHVEEHKLKVIFVDYLQLLSSNRYKNNRELEISYISRELKNIARELNICVVATSQLSRSVEQRGGDKRPILSDLRESGAIEQDADKVLFIYRPEYYGFLQDENGNSTLRQVQLIMCKNRSGNLDVVHLRLDEHYSKFEPYIEPKGGFTIDPDRFSDFDEAPF